jgi:hypothetical protein
LVVRVCTTCHGQTVFTALRMSHRGWENEVRSMVDRGAVANEEEVRAIVDYLSRNFHPQTQQ